MRVQIYLPEVQAFPPGEHFTVPNLPNITAVNVLGDFDIEADRLALLDGEGTCTLVRSLSIAVAVTDPLYTQTTVDPWRPCTPHSEYARDRPDTLNKPFKLIPGVFFNFLPLYHPQLTDDNRWCSSLRRERSAPTIRRATSHPDNSSGDGGVRDDLVEGLEVARAR